MHVQLTDNVTQGCNVHLIGVERILEGFGQRRGFFPQLLLIGVIQLKQFADIFPPRHENEPRVIRIVGQEQPAQREITDGQCVLLQSWV